MFKQPAVATVLQAMLSSEVPDERHAAAGCLHQLLQGVKAQAELLKSSSFIDKVSQRAGPGMAMAWHGMAWHGMKRAMLIPLFSDTPARSISCSPSAALALPLLNPLPHHLTTPPTPPTNRTLLAPSPHCHWL
jgi:hypothetical protein